MISCLLFISFSLHPRNHCPSHIIWLQYSHCSNLSFFIRRDIQEKLPHLASPTRYTLSGNSPSKTKYPELLSFFTSSQDLVSFIAVLFARMCLCCISRVWDAALYNLHVSVNLICKETPPVTPHGCLVPHSSDMTSETDQPKYRLQLFKKKCTRCSKHDGAIISPVDWGFMFLSYLQTHIDCFFESNCDLKINKINHVNNPRRWSILLKASIEAYLPYSSNTPSCFYSSCIIYGQCLMPFSVQQVYFFGSTVHLKYTNTKP